MTWISKYELNKKTKAIINATQMKMEHKGRIVTKLFYEKLTLLLNSNLFMSVLPLFKSFILTFEQKEWLILWLHRSLVEVINNMPYKKLNFINVASNVWKLKTFYVRDESEKLVLLLRKNKIQGDIATDFYRKLCTAYVATAVYIRKKYTLDNPCLELFCALYSRLCQLSLTHKNLFKFGTIIVVKTHLKCKNMSLIQNYCYQKKK